MYYQQIRTSNLGISCKPLGRVMSLCGVPHGSKVLTEFTIPEWIVKDKECFRRFLIRLYDCEGTIDTTANSINITMWKEKSILNNGLAFFESIKNNLLKHFNIKTTNPFSNGNNLRKDGKETKGVTIKVKRQSEVIKFLREIGFENKIKQEKLEKIVQKIIKKKKSGAAGI